MLDELVALVGPDVPVRPTQGSNSGGVSASGGTHDGCGAIDLAGQDTGMTQADRETIRDAGRRVGFAMWIRTPAQSAWPWHLHGIAVQPGGRYDQGCLSPAAHDQVEDYYAGRNGLASGAPDDGPRDWVGVTWETYQLENQPEDDMTPEQAAQLSEVHQMVAWLNEWKDLITGTQVKETHTMVGWLNTWKDGITPTIDGIAAAVGADDE
jgi:hypothetical protein